MASVWIQRKKTLELVEATLVEDISGEVASAIEELWAEDRRKAKERSSGTATLESLHWNWAKKLEDTDQYTTRCIGIECENDYQGLLMLNLSPRPGKLVEPENLLYVEYLEVAPWNQILLVGDQTRFSGVGSILIWAAALVSKQTGLKGRLGLHSLSAARSFYLKLGFTDLGPDEAEDGLHYMELGAEQAAMLVGKEQT